MIYTIIILFAFLYILFNIIERQIYNKSEVSKKYVWDLNYLNHDFSDTKLNAMGMRKCKKCNTYVHHDGYSGRYNIYVPMNYNSIKSVYPDLILTCEEYIIKNIIE